ncbi:hypothetical protein JIN85_03525 [Luteolibacter pohnpeiensis]|uniref:Uncharacterized protein n=1 Tax=Luteolibacter pohnpeiensis TaxID=454153 RepID=A0A934S1F4_9BACT|nr:hypothetical protein [Luteolibacter pohnpeiensis]MBK1881470.1 hypothetical protein [Luteolibacter pohnpeiensis]
MPPINRSPLIRTGLLRDFTAALRQQMYFWGHDVMHPDGNLLVKRGMVKTASAGLKGTSCYAIDWQDGRIHLHGSCAGWHSMAGTSFLYIRPLARCFHWHGEQPVIPGEWTTDLLDSPDPESLYQSSLPFLEWWLDYERWISSQYPPSYREDCHRKLKSVPKTRPWLPPAAALQWLDLFLTAPCQLDRARRFSR